MNRNLQRVAIVAVSVWLAACSGGGGGGSATTVAPPAAVTATAVPTATASAVATTRATTTPAATPTPTQVPAPVPTSSPLPVASAPAAGPTAAPIANQLVLASGFYGEVIATGITAPRQLAALPNGDLLVGSNDTRNVVYIIPNAEATGAPGAPSVFVTAPNGTAQGIAVDGAAANVYVATNQSVWRVPYRSGDRSEPAPSDEIARVRRGGIGTPADGDVHYTTSVAVSGTTLWAGVGSSCNACVESDPTRATIQRVDLTSRTQTTAAKRIRNAVAMTVNPATGTVWAGDAGQDGLLPMNGSMVLGVTDPRGGHPYEFFDPVGARTATADYGWPDCEENAHLYNPLKVSGATCNGVVQPAVALLAYSSILGATFYPANVNGRYAFPAAYRGGAFVAMHGSWHEDVSGRPLALPALAYVPIAGDTPAKPVNWNDPTAQWSTFLYGFQDNAGNRIGRPVGLAVGPQGSLFVADDLANVVYRIRPGSGPSSVRREPRSSSLR